MHIEPSTRVVQSLEPSRITRQNVLSWMLRGFGRSSSQVCCVGLPDLGARRQPLPPKFDVSSTVLLFPSPSATPLSSLEPVRADAIKHIVLVEASWQCAQEVVSHPSLQGVPLIKVDMSGARSGAYWKSAPVFKAREGVGEGSTMLSTIEALAICARDVAALKGRESKGVEEGMLFYFRQEVLRRKRAKEHHSLLA